jgi:hypothetical protein
MGTCHSFSAPPPSWHQEPVRCRVGLPCFTVRSPWPIWHPEPAFGTRSQRQALSRWGVMLSVHPCLLGRSQCIITLGCHALQCAAPALLALGASGRRCHVGLPCLQCVVPALLAPGASALSRWAAVHTCYKILLINVFIPRIHTHAKMP